MATKLNWKLEIRMTNDILIEYADGTFDTNKYGDCWKLIGEATITTETESNSQQEVPDEAPRVVGRIRVESEAFQLVAGEQFIQEQIRRLHVKVAELVKAGNYSDPTQVPKRVLVSVKQKVT